MSVYNGERYLRESLESVLRQSLRDFEFVIIDDGSTDATPSILEECEKSDPRVRVTRQEHAGVVAALVAGCARSGGRLLARIDAEGMSRSEVAALAPLVTTAADGGDAAALAIIASGAAELAHAVATVAEL